MAADGAWSGSKAQVRPRCWRLGRLCGGKERSISCRLTTFAAVSGEENQQKALLPEARPRRQRFFPAVEPAENRIVFVWNSGAPEGIPELLDRVAKGVNRLGHSASMVSCRVVRDPPEGNWKPGGNEVRLRCMEPGLLLELERDYERHRGIRPRIIPHVSVGYGGGGAKEEEGKRGGYWLAVEFGRGMRGLPAESCVAVAKSLRRAVLRAAGGSAPEGLTGHAPDGGKTVRPHAAFLALPFVGAERSDGRINGSAVWLPEELDEDARQAASAAVAGLGTVLELPTGRSVPIRAMHGESELFSLRWRTWARPSKLWATATPIALPKGCGRRGTSGSERRREWWRRVEDVIRTASEQSDLPTPVFVEASHSPFVVGAPEVAAYPPFLQRRPDGGSQRRSLVHAAIGFDEEIEGPILLGAGRYIGLGLLRPAKIDAA